MFADTDAMRAEEQVNGDIVRNDAEAEVIATLIEAFVVCGLPLDKIGVISPYRSQVKSIQNHLRLVSSRVHDWMFLDVCFD